MDFFEAMKANQQKWWKLTTYTECASYPQEILDGTVQYYYFKNEDDAKKFIAKKISEFDSFNGSYNFINHLELIELTKWLPCSYAIDNNGNQIVTDEYLPHDWSNVKYFVHN